MLCQFFPFRYGDDNLQCAEIIEFFLNLLHILANHLARYMVDRRVSDRLIQPRLCHTPDAESSIDYNSLFCSKRHFRVNQCFICHIRIIPAVFSDGTAYFFGTSPDIQQFQIQNNASSKPVLLMFFSLTDPAVFLPDHAICFIITHNEKMLNHFRIFFQKRSIFPGCFSISETYSFPSFLLFQTPQLFFLPVLQFFHQFPYFQAAQSHSFLLPAPVPGDTGRKYSAR